MGRHELRVNLSKIASILEGRLVGDDITVSTLSIPEEQKEDSICIISVKNNIPYMESGMASAYIVTEGLEVSTDKPVIYVKDGRSSLVKLLNAMYPVRVISKHRVGKYTFIHRKAKVYKPCEIGNNVSIDEFTEIGKNTVIHSGVVIGKNVVIGENCIIYPNVTIYDDVEIGNNVIIHGGAVIGADGFGFIPGDNPIKIQQKGIVKINDYVEIGANTCIDRATIGETEIGFGTKIDDLVMIGHNTKLGRACLIASQVGFSGSIKAGDYVVAGGQVGFSDHITIASGSIFGGQSGVPNDIKTKGMYLGSPCMEFKKFAKSNAVFQELPELKKRLRDIDGK